MMVKSFLPCLGETWEKRKLGRDPDRSWCHRHITNMIKPFFGYSPWPSAAAYGQDEVLGIAYNCLEAFHLCGGDTSPCISCLLLAKS